MQSSVRFCIILPLLGILGCGNLSPTSKPVQTASVETKPVMQPVITGDAAKVLSEVDNRITQTTNQVVPWVIALGIVVLAGCGLIIAVLAMGFWLLKRWIENFGYAVQKPIYEAKQRGKI